MHSHKTISKRKSKGKQNNQSDEDECPVCGQEYAQMHRVSIGTHWKDLYQGTAYDYLTRYRRRCSAQVDVEKEEQVRSGEVALYFHGDKKKRARV